MFEILLLGLAPPKVQPILDLKPTTVKQEIVKPKKLTLKQKIDRNYYKCDTDTQYIRKDNARCKDKPVAPKTATQGTQGLNGYAYPSCTGYVALRRYVPPGLGDATTWFSRAQAMGMETGTEPRAGAIGWTWGHVVFVEAVHGDTITISENNYDWQGSTRTIEVPKYQYQYIY